MPTGKEQLLEELEALFERYGKSRITEIYLGVIFEYPENNIQLVLYPNFNLYPIKKLVEEEFDETLNNPFNSSRILRWVSGPILSVVDHLDTYIRSYHNMVLLGDDKIE